MKEPTRTPTGRVAQKLAMAIVVTVVMLATCELGLRVVSKPSPNIVLQSLEVHMRRVKLMEFLDEIVNDPDLFWRLGANKRLPDDARYIRGLISNAAGLREDHEIPLERPRGELRILFIGDSCTFGFGLLHGETFVEMAEQRLRERFPGMAVECINAGVPGYTCMQGWRYLQLKGLAYQPDLVIAAFGWNDAKTWTKRSDLQLAEQRRRETPPGVLAGSEICRRLWRVMARAGDSPAASRPVLRVSPKEYAELLQRMAALCHDAHAEFVPLVWPIRENFLEDGSFPRTPYQLAVKAFAQKHRPLGPNAVPPLIDLILPMATALQSCSHITLFQDGVHTHPYANERIAAAIVEALEPWAAHRVEGPDDGS